MLAGVLNRVSTQRRRLLVVESDGFRLRGAVLRTEGHTVVIEHVAESFAVQSAAALAEVVAQLRRHGLPRRTILLVPEAVPAVLELPVDPADARPAAQMKEMIRWELEAQMASQPSLRSIEEILIGCRYLTGENARRVRTAQESELSNRDPLGSALAGHSSFNDASRNVNRFGELAVDLGLVQREQLDECLTRQAQMRAKENDECVCGWTELRHAAGNRAGHFRWLACGVGQHVRRHWSQLLSVQGLDLFAIYPLVGSSAAALQGQVVSRLAAVIDLQPGMVCSTRLADGRVQSIQLQYTAGRTLSAEFCVEVLGTGPVDEVWLAGRVSDVPDLVAQISARTGRPPKAIPVIIRGQMPDDTSRESLAPMVGAATHALIAGIDRTAGVPAREPSAPLWRRLPIQATVAACATFLILLWLDGSVAWNMRRARDEHAEAVAQRDQVRADKKQVDQQIRRVQQLHKPLQDVQAELVQVRRRRQFLESRLPSSGRFLPELLKALADAANDEVVVDQILEKDGQEIRIAGWSLTENAAQQFIRGIARALPKWELTIAEVRIRDQSGRLGLPGYAMELRFAPLGAELAASNSAAARPGMMINPTDEP